MWRKVMDVMGAMIEDMGLPRSHETAHMLRNLPEVGEICPAWWLTLPKWLPQSTNLFRT